MSEGAWSVFCVVIGAIIGGVGNYVVQYQQRNWEIAAERRKVRQEPLKQARQQIQDLISWAGKCAYGGTSVSKIPGDILGNAVATVEYLVEKHGLALEHDRILELRQLVNQPLEKDKAFAGLALCGELLMLIDQAMEATFE